MYLLLCFVTLALGSIAPTYLFVSRVGPCSGVTNLAITVSELDITRKYYDFIISGHMNITRNLTNGWDIQATMQKCPDVRNLDTCDLYRSFPVVRAGCSGAAADGFDVYNMFFHYTRPRMSCPIEAGSYAIHNYPHFTEDNYLAVAETKISTSLFGYTLRLEGFSDDDQIMCVEVYLRLMYIRNHNWLERGKGGKETTEGGGGEATTPPSDKESEDE